jgi:hypothetical protein
VALDAIKTHFNGRELPMGSKTPGGVVQEVYGLVLAHYFIRRVMHTAAVTGSADPDRLSFTDSLRLVQCHLPVSPPRPATEYLVFVPAHSESKATTLCARVFRQPSRSIDPLLAKSMPRNCLTSLFWHLGRFPLLPRYAVLREPSKNTTRKGNNDSRVQEGHKWLSANRLRQQFSVNKLQIRWHSGTLSRPNG